MLEFDQKLRENKYEKIEDAEKDFRLLFIKHPELCKKLWNKYHPIENLNRKSALTIWIYGPSGVGKTTWTDKFLAKKYKTEQITIKKASSETRPVLWFTLDDENKKVLWIEEIRTNFPEYKDLIQIIDRKTTLEVKGSHIRNNFELIIFNSIYSPLEVYNKLPIGHQTEILRRLYRGNNSQVLELMAGSKRNKFYNKLINRTNNLPEVLLSLPSKVIRKRKCEF